MLAKQTYSYLVPVPLLGLDHKSGKRFAESSCFPPIGSPFSHGVQGKNHTQRGEGRNLTVGAIVPPHPLERSLPSDSPLREGGQDDEDIGAQQNWIADRQQSFKGSGESEARSENQRISTTYDLAPMNRLIEKQC